MSEEENGQGHALAMPEAAPPNAIDIIRREDSGRYKSRRRSTSELFKDQDPDCELSRREDFGSGRSPSGLICVEDLEVQKSASAEAFLSEEEQSPEVVSPLKLTPLKWRSRSMKELTNSLEAAAAIRSGKDLTKVHPDSILLGEAVKNPQLVSGHSVKDLIKIQQESIHAVEAVKNPQPSKRPSQAQLRDQVMKSLSMEQARNISLGPRVNHSQRLEPVKASDEAANISQNGVSTNTVEKREAPLVNPSKQGENLVDSTKAEANGNTVHSAKEEKQDTGLGSGVISLQSHFLAENAENAARARKSEELENSSKGNGAVSDNFTNGGARKTSANDSVVVEPAEIVFQPVDLDKKYHQEELVRHVTAAKIQNREEALLNNPSPPGLNGRKAVSIGKGEETAAMTIEFLRARLQAERSASKPMKLRVEQLTKKVVELETRLLVEVELRKAAEVALQDALSKLKIAIPQADNGVQQVGPPNPPPSTPEAAEAVKNTGERMALPSDSEAKDGPEKVKSGSDGEQALDSSCPVEGKERPSDEKSAGVGDLVPPSATQETSGSSIASGGGLWRDRSVNPPQSQDSLQGLTVDGEGPYTVTQGSQRQEIRSAIEERLRSMWSKIGEEMAALAAVQSDEEPAKKDVTSWMNQLTNVVQEKQSAGEAEAGTKPQRQSLEGQLSVPNRQTDGANSSEQAVNNVTATAEKRNSFKRNSSLAKNVARLVEQYEIQETAQREWEENFEAQQSLEHDGDDVPALVTRDEDVISETEADRKGLPVKAGMARSLSQGDRNTKSNGGPISRSQSLGQLPSQQGVKSGKKSLQGSSLEIFADCPIETGSDNEFLFDPETEIAEELPNGIVLHHSRDDVEPQRRSGKDAIFRKSSERVNLSAKSSPSKSDRRPQSSERFSRTQEFHDEGDQHVRPVREVQDRASRDMYYEPVINGRGARVDAHYSNSDGDFLHRPKHSPEKAVDDMYRSGHRQDAPGMWQEERRHHAHPGHHYAHGSREEDPRMHYGYRERDHLEQDMQYRNAYRYRDDGHRSMPGAGWQEGVDPAMRSRGMSQNYYGYPPPYEMDEPHQPQYVQPGPFDGAGYGSRRDKQYMPHAANNSRVDYYPPNPPSGIPGQGPPMNGMNGQGKPDWPPVSQGRAGWNSNATPEERPAAVGAQEDASGEASEVLKALRIAKQQITNSTTEQQAGFITAQYTVSQDQMYGAGGQVSKTSYTLEASGGYPRVTKTIHEAWQLGGATTNKSSKKRGGAIDFTSSDVTAVTDLISGAGPLTVTNGQSSYVEKLDVGRGIQFFFSGS